MAMGLNCSQNDTTEAYSVTRYRAWWALFMLDTVLCVIMGQPPCIGRYNCTLPLPIPSEKDFGFQSVGQRITDQASRNALITSVFAEDPAAQAREDTLDHTNPAHYGSNTGVAGEQFAHAPSLTPIHNISSLL
jgi:hypothetical protein